MMIFCRAVITSQFAFRKCKLFVICDVVHSNFALLRPEFEPVRIQKSLVVQQTLCARLCAAYVRLMCSPCWLSAAWSHSRDALCAHFVKFLLCVPFARVTTRKCRLLHFESLLCSGLIVLTGHDSLRHYCLRFRIWIVLLQV
jgi:hypothetical protein